MSAYDSEDGARRLGRRFPKIGTLIVRYDIPDGTGIAWEQTLEPGHVDLRGTKEELERYLALDFLADV